jgi:hypothetical protein
VSHQEETLIGLNEIVPATRPKIITTGKQLREQTEAVLHAMYAANVPPSVFVRAGELVRLVPDENGRPKVIALRDASLRGRMARVADYYRLGKGGVEIAIPPPSPVVSDITALGQWAFPGLAGVTEVPVLRENGSILTEAGYDTVSRLFYWPAEGMDVPPIPSHPSAAEIQAAREIIEEALGEFPYDSDASKANAIGTLLTPIVRPAIHGPVPIALLDAPQQGTGKSLLSSVIAITATGRPGAMMAAPDNDEEWRKRITATLYSGPSVITIDNIEGQLKAPSLANALTAEVWKDRILGRSESIELPQLATWMATGNNIRLGGDLQRRAFWIRLDAHSGTPWLGRTFKHPDLKAWVLENRGKIIGALLTLARAWFVAGQPTAKSPILGSYESWSRTIGGILEHAGVHGFLGNLEALYNHADEEAAEWEAFLLSLAGHFRGRDFTTAALGRDLESLPALVAELPGNLEEAWAKRNSGVSLPKRLGKAFSGLKERRFGESEVRIVPAGKAGHVQKWKVIGRGENEGYGRVVPITAASQSDFLPVFIAA